MPVMVVCKLNCSRTVFHLIKNKNIQKMQMNPFAFRLNGDLFVCLLALGHSHVDRHGNNFEADGVMMVRT